jgi:periplasmic protein CpxP/Spy
MENKSLKYWKAFSIILIVMNIALIVFLLLKPFGRPPHPDDKGGPGDFLTEKLNFTETQKTEFTKLRVAHHDSILTLEEEGRKLRKDFYDGLKSDSANTANDSILFKITENQKQIELVTYSHFEDVRKLCTPEQKTTFNDIIQDVIKKLGAPRKEAP